MTKQNVKHEENYFQVSSPVIGPIVKLIAPANSMYNPYAGGYLSIGTCSAITIGWAMCTNDLRAPSTPVNISRGKYVVNWMNTENISFYIDTCI